MIQEFLLPIRSAIDTLIKPKPTPESPVATNEETLIRHIVEATEDKGIDYESIITLAIAINDSRLENRHIHLTEENGNHILLLFSNDPSILRQHFTDNPELIGNVRLFLTELYLILCEVMRVNLEAERQKPRDGFKIASMLQRITDGLSEALNVFINPELPETPAMRDIDSEI